MRWLSCFNDFISITFYEALNANLLIAPVRSIVNIRAAVYPKSIPICMITPSVLELREMIALLNKVLKIPSATMIKNP